MMKHTNHVYSVLGSIAIALVLTGCDLFIDEPIAVAGHVWVGYEPTFLARNEGWLDTRKVHLLETTSASDSLRALQDGKVDGAMLTLDETFKARASGIPLSVVMVFNISAGADMLVARSNISKLSELKGKRIGYEPSSVGDLLLAIILVQAGLSKQDVMLVPISVDKQHDAWVRNQMDAVVTYEPVASQIVEHGGVKLFDTRQTPNLIVDVLAIRSDVLDKRHSDAIRHLIAKHFKALDHLSRNPQDAAYRMSGRLGLTAEGVLAAYKGLVLPDAANNLRLLSGDSSELYKSAEDLSAIMVASGLLKQRDVIGSLIRSEYLTDDFRVSLE